METKALMPEQMPRQQSIKTDSPAKKIFGNRNFVLLWAGQGTSVIGDQFYMIALPWLVLILTGDPVALGLVLALTGIPRAIFMLLGGVLTDRFSQRSVMLASDMLRLLLTAALALVIFSGQIQLWMLYAFAIAFGAVSGLFLPASNSIVPRLVQKEQLMAGNSIIQGTAQLSVFIGPLLAGGLIAFFATSPTTLAGSLSPGMSGIGLAFVVDAFTFLISIVTLWAMTLETPQTPADITRGVLGPMKEGLSFVVNSRKIFLMFLIVAAINFLFTGPALVGVPVLANSRLAEGAAAFGILMASFALGNLLGIVGSSIVKIKPQNLGLTATAIIGIFGLGMISIGFITSTWMGIIILFLLGTMNGYISLVLITMIQKNTPSAMLGRLMSLVILASMGLQPISQALTGALLKVSFEGVFVVCGVGILLIAVLAALSKDVRSFGVETP